jgi:hypothetical protein
MATVAQVDGGAIPPRELHLKDHGRDPWVVAEAVMMLWFYLQGFQRLQTQIVFSQVGAGVR